MQHALPHPIRICICEQSHPPCVALRRKSQPDLLLLPPPALSPIVSPLNLLSYSCGLDHEGPSSWNVCSPCCQTLIHPSKQSRKAPSSRKHSVLPSGFPTTVTAPPPHLTPWECMEVSVSGSASPNWGLLEKRREQGDCFLNK